jgi:hypothetical protein
MANVAAHLVDRVLPAVPIRQWVLSLPFDLRAAAAFRADVLTAIGRVFFEAICARYRSWAKRTGLGDAPTGAVTHVQRFGSSITLNVHFHVMVLDGVFTRDEARRAVFHPAPAPTRAELDDVVRRVHRRVETWLARRKTRDTLEERSQETGAQTPLDACAAIAMGRGSVRALVADPEPGEAGDPTVHVPPHDEGAVDHVGWNLHAGVAIAADDDRGREMLMRYGARPPLALDRLRRLPGGRIAYRIKTLRDGRAKHRVMTPLELLARLAALVAPPRYPLLRYHGVLAPRSPWRRDVVPKPPASRTCEATAQPGEVRKTPSKPKRTTEQRPQGDARASIAITQPTPSLARVPSTDDARPPAPRARVSATDAVEAPAAVLVAPNILSVKHWDRLLGGALYAASPRIDWARLLRRTFDTDVLQCARCAGRLRVMGEVTDPAIVRLVLESLGLPTEGPNIARARDPTDLLGEPEAEA